MDGRRTVVIACSAVCSNEPNQPNEISDAERDLWQLIEVAKAISASLDLDDVLGRIVDGALSVLGADDAAVIVVDGMRRPQLRNERRRRTSRGIAGRWSQTCIDRVLVSGEPVFMVDGVPALGARAVVGAPLRSRGEIRGVLVAQLNQPMHAFTEHKKQVFLALCDHAAIAISNAQLHQARELAHAGSEGVLMIEHDQVQRCNAAACGLMQRSEEQIVGRPVLALFDAADRAAVIGALVDADPGPCEVHLLRDGAAPRLVEMTIALSHDGACVMVIRDISRQRELHQRMVQADRLASIGIVAAGVAHGINNPLTYMSCNAHMLIDWLSLPPERISAERLAEARELLEEISDGVDRIAGMVKDLGMIAREPHGDVGAADLAATLKSSVRIASAHIGKQARVDCEVGKLPPVAASAPRLGQVFLHLLVNAAPASSGQGADEQEVRIRAQPRERMVRVEIDDTRPGEDSGFGLWLCRGILRSMGGTIDVQPGASRGRRVVVDLPIAQG